MTKRRSFRHFTHAASPPSLTVMRKPIIALCAALACLGLWPRAGGAQSYPSRPITMVVPLAAGGPLDTMARIIAEPMRAALGQPIIVENVTGAAGTVGTGRVARAAPDGYTLELGFLGTHVFNGAIYQLGYDVEKDFEPIALLSSNPHVVVTRLSLPAVDLKGLTAWLQANNQKVSAGSAGVGSSTHMGAILFGNLIGVRMAIIPYRGAAPALQDVIAGQTDLMVDVLSNSLPHIQSGKVRPFAITAAARVSSAPDIPTVDETGLPGFHMSTWYALFGPKGMPRDVVAKLETAVRAALADPPCSGAAPRSASPSRRRTSRRRRRSRHCSGPRSRNGRPSSRPRTSSRNSVGHMCRAQSSPKLANTRRLSAGAALAVRKNSLANRKPMPLSPTACLSACSDARTAAKPSWSVLSPSSLAIRFSPKRSTRRSRFSFNFFVFG